MLLGFLHGSSGSHFGTLQSSVIFCVLRSLACERLESISAPGEASREAANSKCNMSVSF